ncbi:MAG: phage distal tail protein, Rcc01695 family [Rhizomicrobium sp.]
MSFHEIRFPTAIAFHSTGGPVRKTEIVTLGSGFEERNAVWANSRRRYDVGYGVKTLDDLHDVIAFFEARMARLHGFRLKDFADFKSCAPTTEVTATDQALGTGDGATVAFALVKTYASGPSSWTRAIAKPVSGTVQVALDGVVQASGVSIDATTGLVTFVTPPAPGAAITAGFEFDVPVRFDTDSLSVNLSDFAAGDIPSIPLVEIAV